MKEITAEILLTTYNGETYIREQIDSILEQNDERWHLTVSDDGSTDRTSEILDEYVKRYSNRITRVRSGKRFGNARDHFFWLIGQCKADYIFTCDQDDRWYQTKVKRQMDALLAAEKQYGKKMPLLVFSDQTPTDAQLNPLAPSLMRYQNQFFEHFDYRSILMQNVVTGGAMVFNRALADLAMQCEDPAQTIMHDWWVAAVAARFGKIIYIDEPLSDYRQHGTNSVGAKDVRSIQYMRDVFLRMEELHKQVCRKKTQALVFSRTYGRMLEDSDCVFLEGFVKRRSGLLFFWNNRGLIHGLFRLVGMMLLG